MVVGGGWRNLGGRLVVRAGKGRALPRQHGDEEVQDGEVITDDLAADDSSSSAERRLSGRLRRSPLRGRVGDRRTRLRSHGADAPAPPAQGQGLCYGAAPGCARPRPRQCCAGFTPPGAAAGGRWRPRRWRPHRGPGPVAGGSGRGGRRGPRRQDDDDDGECALGRRSLVLAAEVSQSGCDWMKARRISWPAISAAHPPQGRILVGAGPPGGWYRAHTQLLLRQHWAGDSCRRPGAGLAATGARRPRTPAAAGGRRGDGPGLRRACTAAGDDPGQVGGEPHGR